MMNYLNTLILALICSFLIVSCSDGAENVDLASTTAEDSTELPAPQKGDVETPVDTAQVAPPANVPACEFIGSWTFVEIAGVPADEGQKELVLTFNADGTASTTGHGKVREALWSTEDCEVVLMDAADGPDQTMSDIKYEEDRMSFKANDLDLIVVQRKVETPAE